MLISKDSLPILKPEQTYYLVNSHGVTKDIYLGKFGTYHIFANNSKQIKVYENNPHTCYEISSKRMHTTYKEACLRFKELLLNLIDHYNSHELKDIPIKIK